MSLSPKKIKHEMKKAIKIAQKKIPDQDKELLDPFYGKKKVKAAADLKKSKTPLEKKKPKKKVSKRTKPGTVLTTEATPANTHTEGVRWNKIVKEKNLLQSRRLTHKMDKSRKK